MIIQKKNYSVYSKREVHNVFLTLQRTQNTFPPNEGLANIHPPCHACSVLFYVMMIVQLLDAFPLPPPPPPSLLPQPSLPF
jgi:hypothetical protein